MQTGGDDYYERRAREERVRADNSENEVVATTHRRMAELYERRLAQGDFRPAPEA